MFGNIYIWFARKIFIFTTHQSKNLSSFNLKAQIRGPYKYSFPWLFIKKLIQMKRILIKLYFWVLTNNKDFFRNKLSCAICSRSCKRTKISTELYCQKKLFLAEWFCYLLSPEGFYLQANYYHWDFSSISKKGENAWASLWS